MYRQKTEEGKFYDREREGRDRFLKIYGECFKVIEETENRFDKYDLRCHDFEEDCFFVEVKTRNYPSDKFDDFVINCEKYDALMFYSQEDRTYAIFAVFCNDGVGYIFNLTNIDKSEMRYDPSYCRHSEKGNGEHFIHKGAYFLPKSKGIKING